MNSEDALVVTLYLVKLVSKFQLADEFNRKTKTEDYVPEDSIRERFNF